MLRVLIQEEGLSKNAKPTSPPPPNCWPEAPRGGGGIGGGVQGGRAMEGGFWRAGAGAFRTRGGGRLQLVLMRQPPPSYLSKLVGGGEWGGDPAGGRGGSCQGSGGGCFCRGWGGGVG